MCLCFLLHYLHPHTHIHGLWPPPIPSLSACCRGDMHTRVARRTSLAAPEELHRFLGFCSYCEGTGLSSGFGGGCTVAVETQLVTFFCRLYILLYYFKSFFSIKKKLQDLWRCVTPFVNAELPGKSARVGGVCSSIMTAWSHAALCWQIRSATLQKWHPHTGS